MRRTAYNNLQNHDYFAYIKEENLSSFDSYIHSFVKYAIIFGIIILFFILSFSVLLSQSTFSKDRLEKAVVSFVKNEVGELCEVEIIENIQTESFDYDDISAKIISNYDLIGIGKLTIRFERDGKLVKNLYIKINVNRLKKMPVAIRTLKAGETISKNDVTEKIVTANNSLNTEPLDINSIIGRTIRNGVARNTIISESDLLKHRTVRRGETIELVAYSGAVVIRTNAVALQDGSIGDIIRVKREGQGNSILSGQVGDDGLVYIKAISGGKR